MKDTFSKSFLIVSRALADFLSLGVFFSLISLFCLDLNAFEVARLRRLWLGGGERKDLEEL